MVTLKVIHPFNYIIKSRLSSKMERNNNKIYRVSYILWDNLEKEYYYYNSVLMKALFSTC